MGPSSPIVAHLKFHGYGGNVGAVAVVLLDDGRAVATATSVSDISASGHPEQVRRAILSTFVLLDDADLIVLDEAEDRLWRWHPEKHAGDAWLEIAPTELPAGTLEQLVAARGDRFDASTR